jgi:hypothetical protein
MTNHMSEYLEMRIPESMLHPYSEAPDSPCKRQLDKYFADIQSKGYYLHGFPETKGGEGLLLYDDGTSGGMESEELVIDFLGEIATSDETLVPPRVKGRGMDWAKPITRLEPARRAQVWTSENVTDLSKEFDSPEHRAEYRGLTGAGAPLFLAFLYLEGSPPTEWNKRVIYNVLSARYRAGLVTIVTTNMSLSELLPVYGRQTASVLAKHFVVPHSWSA